MAKSKKTVNVEIEKPVGQITGICYRKEIIENSELLYKCVSYTNDQGEVWSEEILVEESKE